MSDQRSDREAGRSGGAVVNLRRVRKARARDEKKKQADANAALHGLAKADKVAARIERERADRALDAHHRDEGET